MLDFLIGISRVLDTRTWKGLLEARVWLEVYHPIIKRDIIFREGSFESSYDLVPLLTGEFENPSFRLFNTWLSKGDHLSKDDIDRIADYERGVTILSPYSGVDDDLKFRLYFDTIYSLLLRLLRFSKATPDTLGSNFLLNRGAKYVFGVYVDYVINTRFRNVHEFLSDIKSSSHLPRCLSCRFKICLRYGAKKICEINNVFKFSLSLIEICYRHYDQLQLRIPRELLNLEDFEARRKYADFVKMKINKSEKIIEDAHDKLRKLVYGAFSNTPMENQMIKNLNDAYSYMLQVIMRLCDNTCININLNCSLLALLKASGYFEDGIRDLTVDIIDAEVPKQIRKFMYEELYKLIEEQSRDISARFSQEIRRLLDKLIDKSCGAEKEFNIAIPSRPLVDVEVLESPVIKTVNVMTVGFYLRKIYDSHSEDKKALCVELENIKKRLVSVLDQDIRYLREKGYEISDIYLVGLLRKGSLYMKMLRDHVNILSEIERTGQRIDILYDAAFVTSELFNYFYVDEDFQEFKSNEESRFTYLILFDDIIRHGNKFIKSLIKLYLLARLRNVRYIVRIVSLFSTKVGERTIHEFIDKVLSNEEVNKYVKVLDASVTGSHNKEKSYIVKLYSEEELKSKRYLSVYDDFVNELMQDPMKLVVLMNTPFA